MEDKAKALRMMRYWLFGTFVIVFASVTIYVGGVWQTGLDIMYQPNYWLGILIAAAGCVGAYYFYRWWLGRKQA